MAVVNRKYLLIGLYSRQKQNYFSQRIYGLKIWRQIRYAIMFFSEQKSGGECGCRRRLRGLHDRFAVYHAVILIWPLQHKRPWIKITKLWPQQTHKLSKSRQPFVTLYIATMYSRVYPIDWHYIQAHYVSLYSGRNVALNHQKEDKLKIKLERRL